MCEVGVGKSVRIGAFQRTLRNSTTRALGTVAMSLVKECNEGFRVSV